MIPGQGNRSCMPQLRPDAAEINNFLKVTAKVFHLSASREIVKLWFISYNQLKLCIQFSRSIVSDSLQPHGLQHARPPCPSPTPGDYSNSRPLSWRCHPTISSSVLAFSSHLQSFPALGSFQMNQFFTSGGQSIGVSASASVLPVNIQD